ncbi:hypothetical protein HK101_004244 [Irineochytrium annulatum]|nr:hypothetical protein HK101_004244 [Irineochytrium annulatum]
MGSSNLADDGNGSASSSSILRPSHDRWSGAPDGPDSLDREMESDYNDLTADLSLATRVTRDDDDDKSSYARNHDPRPVALAAVSAVTARRRVSGTGSLTTNVGGDVRRCDDGGAVARGSRPMEHASMELLGGMGSADVLGDEEDNGERGDEDDSSVQGILRDRFEMLIDAQIKQSNMTLNPFKEEADPPFDIAKMMRELHQRTRPASHSSPRRSRPTLSPDYESRSGSPSPILDARRLVNPYAPSPSDASPGGALSASRDFDRVLLADGLSPERAAANYGGDDQIVFDGYEEDRIGQETPRSSSGPTNASTFLASQGRWTSTQTGSTNGQRGRSGTKSSTATGARATSSSPKKQSVGENVSSGKGGLAEQGKSSSRGSPKKQASFGDSNSSSAFQQPTHEASGRRAGAPPSINTAASGASRKAQPVSPLSALTNMSSGVGSVYSHAPNLARLAHPMGGASSMRLSDQGPAMVPRVCDLAEPIQHLGLLNLPEDSNSRAVLNALRVLQAKVYSLETEKRSANTRIETLETDLTRTAQLLLDAQRSKHHPANQVQALQTQLEDMQRALERERRIAEVSHEAHGIAATLIKDAEDKARRAERRLEKEKSRGEADKMQRARTEHAARAEKERRVWEERMRSQIEVESVEDEELEQTPAAPPLPAEKGQKVQQRSSVVGLNEEGIDRWASIDGGMQVADSLEAKQREEQMRLQEQQEELLRKQEALRQQHLEHQQQFAYLQEQQLMQLRQHEEERRHIETEEKRRLEEQDRVRRQAEAREQQGIRRSQTRQEKTAAAHQFDMQTQIPSRVNIFSDEAVQTVEPAAVVPPSSQVQNANTITEPRGALRAQPSNLDLRRQPSPSVSAVSFADVMELENQITYLHNRFALLEDQIQRAQQSPSHAPMNPDALPHLQAELGKVRERILKREQKLMGLRLDASSPTNQLNASPARQRSASSSPIFTSPPRTSASATASPPRPVQGMGWGSGEGGTSATRATTPAPAVAADVANREQADIEDEFAYIYRDSRAGQTLFEQVPGWEGLGDHEDRCCAGKREFLKN